MTWTIGHTDVAVNSESEAVSNSTVFIHQDGVTIKLAATPKPEKHILGAKRALVDSANILENMAREMKKRADKLY